MGRKGQKEGKKEGEKGRREGGVAAGYLTFLGFGWEKRGM